jgi:DNA (cytosine-5)-methyltransferase 1
LKRIREAGYFVNYYVLSSSDYGVPQSRVRIYIIGFREKEYSLKFSIPQPLKKKLKLGDILSDFQASAKKVENGFKKDLFRQPIQQKSMSLSNNNGFNDYFLFNDLRNGHSTIHSWDIINTTEKQKLICYLLLKNRRKSAYGKLDGNPLSLTIFKELDPTIAQDELDELVNIDIFKLEEYAFAVNKYDTHNLSEEEKTLLECHIDNKLIIDDLKSNRVLKRKKIAISKTIQSLQQKNIIVCDEVRYDFKNAKISTGLYGISRIFLPSSSIFPTLVASDSNDYITRNRSQKRR